jgi:hypothetical protein
LQAFVHGLTFTGHALQLMYGSANHVLQELTTTIKPSTAEIQQQPHNTEI